MLVQLLLSLGLLVLASDPTLAGKRRNQREQTQLGVSLADPSIINGNDSCPPECPSDCKDLYDKGYRKDGVYVIYLSLYNSEPALVYCQMQSYGGGWTVFQRRINGFVDFFRDWDEYYAGFGYLKSEYWLGLRKLHFILANKEYRLRIDMAMFNGSTAYAEYSYFTVGSPLNKFRLGLGKFEGGTAGDSMIWADGSEADLRGMMFSTKDQDNDKCGRCDCAGFSLLHGAWWYNYCAGSNLNGLYNTDVGQESAQNVFWYSFNEEKPLKSVSMKFKPM